MKTRETEILFVSFSRTHTCAMKKKWTHKDARVTEFGVFSCVSAISGVHFGVEFQNCNKMCNSCNFLVQRATASAPKQKRVYWGKKSERQTDRQKNAYNQIQFWVLECCSYCTLRLRLCEDKVFNFVTFCRSTQWTSQIVDLSEKCSETLEQLLPLLSEPWLSPVAPVYVVRVCSIYQAFCCCRCHWSIVWGHGTPAQHIHSGCCRLKSKQQFNNRGSERERDGQIWNCHKEISFAEACTLHSAHAGQKIEISILIERRIFVLLSKCNWHMLRRIYKAIPSILHANSARVHFRKFIYILYVRSLLTCASATALRTAGGTECVRERENRKTVCWWERERHKMVFFPLHACILTSNGCQTQRIETTQYGKQAMHWNARNLNLHVPAQQNATHCTKHTLHNRFCT